MVDVVVIDRDGAPVQGLTAADFAVTVEGSPRPVANAAYVGYEGTASAKATPEASSGEGYVTNQDGMPPRLLVFVIDESHVRPMAAKAVLDTAGGMLDALAPGDLVAVARLPRLTQGTDFTTDREAVKKALSEATGRGQPFRTPVYGLTLGVAAEYLRGHRPDSPGGARHPVPEPRRVQLRRTQLGPAVHGGDLQRGARPRRRLHAHREG